jgi:hypothetical protein
MGNGGADQMSKDRSEDIPFVQFLLPHGQRRPMIFKGTRELAQIAADIRARGYEFHAEILTTDEVSLTCFNVEAEEDVAIELCPNGPEVLAGVERLIRSAKEEIRADGK